VKVIAASWPVEITPGAKTCGPFWLCPKPGRVVASNVTTKKHFVRIELSSFTLPAPEEDHWKFCLLQTARPLYSNSGTLLCGWPKPTH
jgi:hypothetical protein